MTAWHFFSPYPRAGNTNRIPNPRHRDSVMSRSTAVSRSYWKASIQHLNLDLGCFPPPSLCVSPCFAGRSVTRRLHSCAAWHIYCWTLPIAILLSTNDTVLGIVRNTNCTLGFRSNWIEKSPRWTHLEKEKRSEGDEAAASTPTQTTLWSEHMRGHWNARHWKRRSP